MKSITLLLLLFITSTISAQSPWAKEKGNIFVNISFSTISNYEQLFGEPDYFINGVISDNTYQFYSEYGITDKTSLLLNIPLKNISLEEYKFCNGNTCIGNDYNKTAFGNISLGIKHQFYNDGWVLAGQLVTELNTSTFNATSGIRTGYDAYTFTPQLLVGKSFGKTFFQSHIGFDIRTNNYSNNFKIGGEFGGKLLKNIWLLGFLDISEVIKEGFYRPGELSPQTFEPRNGLYVTDQEYGAYGLKAIYQLDNLGITTSFATAFSGNNVPKQSAISVGIFNTF